jgi:hypothetical protein
MKVTATILGKVFIAAIAGWGFGVVASQPFKKSNEAVAEKSTTQQSVYKLVQQNAEFNKQNTVKGIEKIPNCTYVYEDVTNKPNVKCKIPCVTLYKGPNLLYKWEGNIMMKNDVTVQKIQEQMK